ncbi:DeoR/GlpR family DNA-binding transcription regulator [Zophobihabitans entericus]|uniref:DeoR/GlpR transcriptional regulator n=1 Tax=Zophobihabitans entericus TaxID=1635327 RepID=A0A6G9IDY9_9GAMM|nr:DeoR/GlpR transcriptional regulator [Zophobihabitans entericus]
MNERQEVILYKVNEVGQISVAELAELTGVSVVTIRQDLNFLEQNGHLKRVHGSAVAIDGESVDARMKVNFVVKQKIAEYAASLVENGERIFIEGGSTNALLARYLAYSKRITLITSSYYIAHLLGQIEAPIEVIVLGGEYQKHSESVVGDLACLGIGHLSFSKAFIGIDGYHSSTGFAGRNKQRTEVVNAILAKDSENIVITDSSKFGQVQAYPFMSPVNNIDRVITDGYLLNQHEQHLIQKGVIVDKVMGE